MIGIVALAILVALAWWIKKYHWKKEPGTWVKIPKKKSHGQT